MSKVAIVGNASGTGTFTIAAPNSNSDRTLTLPDDTGTVVYQNASGNVGIGTSSPSYKLHSQIASSTVAAGYFYNTSGSGNSPALIARGGANNTGLARIIEAQDYSGNTEFAISGTGEMFANAGFGSAGAAYLCRAWVNFNGTGTVAIRASGNVSSITDDGTGVYTVNFTTSMPDANYSVSTTAMETGSTGVTDWSAAIRRNTNVSDSMSTSFCKVAAFSAGSTAVDAGVIVVSIFR